MIRILYTYHDSYIFLALNLKSTKELIYYIKVKIILQTNDIRCRSLSKAYISSSLLSLTANRPRWKKNSTKKQNQNDYFIDEMNTINCLCFILIIGVNLYVHVLYIPLCTMFQIVISEVFISVFTLYVYICLVI